MQVCEQLIREYEQTSQSDTSKTYIVKLRTADNPFPTCTCIAYAIKRNRNRKDSKVAGLNSMVAGDCKHVQRVIRDACMWMAPDGAPPLSDNICPECGGPLVELDSIRVDVGGSKKLATIKREEEEPGKKVGDMSQLLKDLLRESGQA